MSEMRRFLLILLALAVAPAPARAAQKPADPVLTGETAAYYFLIARRHESAGRVDEAIAALERAIELEPQSGGIRAELAALYARENRALEALEAAEEALKYDAGNEEANRVLGTIYASLSEQRRRLRPTDDPAQYLPKAIAALEKARGSSPTDPGLEFTLGRLYLRANRPDEAVVALNRVFEYQPEYSDGGMLLSAAQEAAGRLEDATTTMETTVRANPDFFRGYVRLIELYERQQRWKDAASTYARAQQVNPRADLASGRAAALINSGAPREAQDVLRAAIERKSAADPALLYLLAEAQRRTGDYVAASATVQKLRAEFPDDTRGLAMEARILAAQGRKTEAIVAFGELIKRTPDEPMFVYQYAQLLDETGKPAEAERALRDLLARKPDDANALNSLGYMFAERGQRLDEAVSLLKRALELEPGNPSFLDSLGWAYFKQGKFDLADAPLTEAAEKMPGNSVIQDHLGDLRLRQGRLDDAIASWERALAGDGESIDKAAIEKKVRAARKSGK